MALATHALNDFPLENLVLADDSSLVLVTSLKLWRVGSMVLHVNIGASPHPVIRTQVLKNTCLSHYLALLPLPQVDL
jgi:hypothetical protein